MTMLQTASTGLKWKIWGGKYFFRLGIIHEGQGQGVGSSARRTAGSRTERCEMVESNALSTPMDLQAANAI